MPSNAKSFAELEFDILAKSNTDKDNRPIIEEFREEILALVDKFGQSGQSGGSAPYVAAAISSAVKKLCLFEPICPITGHEDEWNDVSMHSSGETLYQNKRCSALFKDSKDSPAHYVNAIVKKTEDSGCWSGSFWLSEEDYLSGDRSKMIHSSQVVKSFPFEPKTFYIDVIEKEIAPGDWEMWCKDPAQLDEVWEYYDRYTPLPRQQVKTETSENELSTCNEPKKSENNDSN